ncbi:MAG: hypothetical protein MJ170_03985 [Alphaproteobacteria bacterium]|nr:hypothetical protein [Alphaproteobacteria bacterium]
MEYIKALFYLIIVIASIILFYCLYKIGVEKQKLLTPAQKEQQYNSANLISGWSIALLPIIICIVEIFIELPRVPFDVLMCVIDREGLKKQKIWEQGQIAWGWCLLSPVYLYKRTKLLKENMTKFWILIAQYCLMVTMIILEIFFDVLIF